jgi:hypothetical protein
MPSTQTRTKLKKFQFVDGAPPVEPAVQGNADKENAITAQEAAEKTCETPKLATSKTCPPPSTPGARLPLAELVGNVDDSSRHMVKAVVSPEEQLCWRGSQSINTPLPRKRKRARSSSPAAPSQEDPRGQDSARKDFTTPQADPNTELWNRYTNNKGTPSGTRAVAFAHLISESSPHSLANAGSVSGLRRWASCGVEFPASTKKKKRRISGAFAVATEQIEDVFHQRSSDGGPQVKKSGLASLVESLKEAIPKRPSAVASHPPSSSSPLPDHEPFRLPVDSPIRLRTIDEHLPPEDTSETLGGEAEAVAELDEADHGRSSSGSSDDFGDFDDEMVDALEITNHEPVSHHDQDPRPDELESVVAVPPDHETDALPTIPTNYCDSDDEFDLDEDIFAADLEQVASLYDRRPEMSAAEQEVQMVDGASDARPPVISLLDDDDDFGDDIDADEFEAAEIAATQAPATTVRRPRTY